MSGRRALLRRCAALLVAVLAVLLVPAQAHAEDATIGHVESTGDGLRILVDVPAGVQVDLGGVTATLEGQALDATAEGTSSGSVVKRTTILVVDTSNSMRRQGRFAAAKQAASTYLDAVPADVAVGIVTFDSKVTVALAPTTDRAAAQTVVDGLALHRDTLLYDGVIAAAQAAGDDGQRTLLVLSDGADAGSTASLDAATAAIKDAGLRVHAVGLDLGEKQLTPLRTLAAAGKGEVITASGAALAQTFAAEAEALADQVLVTAPLPDGFDAELANVEVSLPTTASGTLVARALAPVQSAGSASVTPAPQPTLTDERGWVAPGWLLWAGLGAFALGLLAVAVLLVPSRPAPMSIADRVTAYSTRVTGLEERHDTKPPAEPVLDQAKAAAASVLEHNSALNERMTRRLAAAGSEFKPSEWLLVHIGAVLAAGVIGLLLGRGNIIVGLLFMVIGFLIPPIYLRFMAGRRRRAFDNALPEVLQLLSGALSAGLSLAQAVDTVVREGPEPIASEFKRVLVEARIGVSIEDAFEGVAARFQSKDFGWAVMAIRIQRQVGGNLAELLTTVAATMRERQYLRRHVRALSAEGRLSAVILCILPPAFAVFLFVANRSFLDPLVHDPRGWILTGFGVLWMAIGSFWMSQMVKVDA